MLQIQSWKVVVSVDGQVSACFGAKQNPFPPKFLSAINEACIRDTLEDVTAILKAKLNKLREKQRIGQENDIQVKVVGR